MKPLKNKSKATVEKESEHLDEEPKKESSLQQGHQ